MENPATTNRHPCVRVAVRLRFRITVEVGSVAARTGNRKRGAIHSRDDVANGSVKSPGNDLGVERMFLVAEQIVDEPLGVVGRPCKSDKP